MKIVLLTIVLGLAYCAKAEDLTLVQAQVFARHGARTTLKDYHEFYAAADWAPTMKELPNATPTYEVVDMEGQKYDVMSPSEKKYRKVVLGTYKALDGTDKNIYGGQLTYIGKQEEYKLGQDLAQFYDGKLYSGDFNSDKIYVRSTNIVRTQESAAAIIAGMFGGANQVKGLKVHVMKYEDENIFPNTGNCPMLGAGLGMVFGQLYKNFPLFVKLPAALCTKSGHGGDKLGKCMHHLNSIYVQDDLNCRSGNNLTIPADMVKDVPELNRIFAFFGFGLSCGPKSMMKQTLPLACGILYHDVIDRMDAATKGNAGQKLFIFGGHDVTIVPQMNALGIWKDMWPGFASNIRYELYKNEENKYFVKVLFNGKDIVVGSGKGPCGDNTLCPLEKFKEALKPIARTPEERKNECGEGLGGENFGA